MCDAAAECRRIVNLFAPSDHLSGPKLSVFWSGFRVFQTNHKRFHFEAARGALVSGGGGGPKRVPTKFSDASFCDVSGTHTLTLTLTYRLHIVVARVYHRWYRHFCRYLLASRLNYQKKRNAATDTASAHGHALVRTCACHYKVPLFLPGPPPPQPPIHFPLDGVVLILMIE